MEGMGGRRVLIFADVAASPPRDQGGNVSSIIGGREGIRRMSDRGLLSRQDAKSMFSVAGLDLLPGTSQVNVSSAALHGLTKRCAAAQQ